MLNTATFILSFFIWQYLVSIKNILNFESLCRNNHSSAALDMSLQLQFASNVLTCIPTFSFQINAQWYFFLMDLRGRAYEAIIININSYYVSKSNAISLGWFGTYELPALCINNIENKSNLRISNLISIIIYNVSFICP